MTIDDVAGGEGVLVRTAPLGGGALSQSLQRGETHGWIAALPRGIVQWRTHIQHVHASRRPDWLSSLLPAIAPTGAAAERLARAAAHGVVLTTGQQPGLFGGPSYTWSKAMSALALADVLEHETGIPVAPLFWAATDDADWAEAASTHAADTRGLATMTLVGPATDGVAMSDVLLGDLTTALSQLRDACGSAAHASVVRSVEMAYQPQATIGGAYVQFMRAMLEPLGMAVLDASHPALRAAADPVLRRALANASQVSDALAARTQEIRAAGFSPQVEPIDTLSLVFQTERRSSNGANEPSSGQTSGHVKVRVPVAVASQCAEDAPLGSLGANVLLRPVVERALVPTACYVAGPGELAYFAQVSAVASAIDAVVPMVVPRWAGEVIDAHVMSTLHELRVDESILRDPHALENALASRAVDEELRDAVERLRVTVETQGRAVGDVVANTGHPIAPSVITGLQRDLTHRLERFERRVRADAKRRATDLMRVAGVLRAALRPRGASPERVLTLVPMLARYGPQLLVRMRDAAAVHAQALVQGPDDTQ